MNNHLIFLPRPPGAMPGGHYRNAHPNGRWLEP